MVLQEGEEDVDDAVGEGAAGVGVLRAELVEELAGKTTNAAGGEGCGLDEEEADGAGEAAGGDGHVLVLADAAEVREDVDAVLRVVRSRGRRMGQGCGRGGG